MKSITSVVALGLCIVPFTEMNGQSVTAEYINGIPQADQFPGGSPVDACLQINNAAAYAITNHIDQVDATHFLPSATSPFVVNCMSNPFNGLSATIAAPLNLTINFGAVVFASTVPWVIQNSAITLNGEGNTQTVVEYTGTTAGSNVLYAHAQLSAPGFTNGLGDVDIRNMMFVGNPTYVTDAVLLEDVNRSNFSNVAAWGASNCGIHTEGAVTDTFFRTKVSSVEYSNVFPLGTATTANGFCFDKSSVSNNWTTNGTVTDAAAEYVTHIGWHLIGAQTMTFTSGTSEHNGQGVTVDPGDFNKFNTIIDPDLESNGTSPFPEGVDIDDNGQSNTYINPLAASCPSCIGVYASGGGAQYILGEEGVTNGIANIGGSFNVLGARSSLGHTGPVAFPILTSNGSAPTITKGTNVTSANCTIGHTCTDSRGSIAIAGGTATTGVIATLAYAGTYAGAPECIVVAGSDPSIGYNLTWSSPTTTGFNITAGNSVAGQVVYVQYSCTD